jgi:hypothetical protein
MNLKREVDICRACGYKFPWIVAIFQMIRFRNK